MTPDRGNREGLIRTMLQSATYLFDFLQLSSAILVQRALEKYLFKLTTFQLLIRLFSEECTILQVSFFSKAP